MKKSIIFGVLAMFAVSAMSIQGVEAQNPVKKTKETAVKVEKKATQDIKKASAVTTKDGKTTLAPTESKTTLAPNKDKCCEKKVVDTKKKTDVKPSGMIKPNVQKPKVETKTTKPANAEQK